MKKGVSLVLSSGGARGLAHIGVIEELLAQDFEIKSISGSSMGALIGGIYAAGNLENYKDWVCELDKLDIFKLVDFTFSFQGFIRGEKIFVELEKFLSNKNIEDLPIHFTAVATDLKNKNEVVFREGSLLKAVRASIAIPTVFTPLYLDGQELVDGGVLNPLPIDLVQRTKDDLLVVVNVNAYIPCKKEIQPETGIADVRELNYISQISQFKARVLSMLPNTSSTPKKLSFFDLMNKSYDLMQDRLSSLILKNHDPDIVVDVSRNICSTFEFYKGKEIIEEGRAAFRTAVQKSIVKV